MPHLRVKLQACVACLLGVLCRLTRVKLLKGAGTADPAITVLGFESLQAFRAAAKESGAVVMGDVAKFTDVAPIVQINEELN